MIGSVKPVYSLFFIAHSDAEFHQGIKILLTDYYDPMYRYQLDKKSTQILFEGPEQAYLEWAKDYIDSD